MKGANAAAQRGAAVSIRRILVAIDGSPASLQALAAAVRLASLLHAEVDGLFVEDTDLLSFAELPFSSLTTVHFGSGRRMRPVEVERSLRAQAQRARDAVFRASAEAGIHWTFRVVRGNVHREVMRAASGADLLSLGSIGTSSARRRSGGSVAHRAARLAPRSVLIQRHPCSPRGPVVVALSDEALPSLAALETAALVARSVHCQLVLLLPADAAGREGLRARAREAVEPRGIRPQWLEPQSAGPRACLAEAVRAAQRGILVLDADSPLIQQEQIARLIDRGGCSLLIVRDLPTVGE